MNGTTIAANAAMRLTPPMMTKAEHDDVPTATPQVGSAPRVLHRRGHGVGLHAGQQHTAGQLVTAAKTNP